MARNALGLEPVLGIVHQLWTPISGEFDDYIAKPKPNGYQSLHTVVRDVDGRPIEIQIRTREMEAMANNGIAAHWLYKTDGQSTNGSHTRAREWVQGLLEMQQRAGNSLEFIENVKIDLFPDEVYVFTPRGNILSLPKGATAVDFAYVARGARFAQTEVKIGIIPGAGGTQTLARAIGERRAKELILTGAVFTAEQALDWGLANAIYPIEELLPAALQTAETIAANAPIAVRQAKLAIGRGGGMGVSDGLAMEIEAYNRTIPTEDRREGVAAFNEKRPPVFRGE